MGPALRATTHGAPVLALVAALEGEASGLRRRLALAPERVAGLPGAAYSGQCGRRPVLLACSGMGRRRAEAALEAVLAHHDALAVVSFGFSGGLQGRLAAGDLILASELMGSTGPAGEIEPTVFRADRELLRAATQALETARLPAVCGATVTAPGIVDTPAGKESLGRRTGAVAVDMESYWLARAASTRGLPFLAIRAISDGVGDRLPPLDLLLDGDDGAPGAGRLAALLVRQPGSLAALLRMARNAGRARRALTAGVACALAELAEKTGP